MNFTKDYYSLHEVADLLSVHYQSVRAWVKAGKLRAVKLGKVYRVSKEALHEFTKGA